MNNINNYQDSHSAFLLQKAQNIETTAMHDFKTGFLALASTLVGLVLPASSSSTLKPKPVSETGIPKFVLDYGIPFLPSPCPLDQQADN